MVKQIDQLYPQICNDYLNGFSQSELLKKYSEFGVTHYTISVITKSVSDQKLSIKNKINCLKNKTNQPHLSVNDVKINTSLKEKLTLLENENKQLSENQNPKKSENENKNNTSPKEKVILSENQKPKNIEIENQNPKNSENENKTNTSLKEKSRISLKDKISILENEKTKNSKNEKIELEKKVNRYKKAWETRRKNEQKQQFKPKK